jgi:hypothetical protein
MIGAASQCVVAGWPSSSPASASTIEPVQIEQTVAPAAWRSRSQAVPAGHRPRGSKPGSNEMSATTTTSAGQSVPCGCTGRPTGVGIGAPSCETMRGASAHAPVGSPVSCGQAVPAEASTS